jgi:hypothetical protein
MRQGRCSGHYKALISEEHCSVRATDWELPHREPFQYLGHEDDLIAKDGEKS